MITLITGSPGTGKTAALVQLLGELGKDRALYVHGIPDLKIPHEPLPTPEDWPDVVPDGSIVVIDEVQTVWRPRGPGQKVPDHVAKLETHRHRGLDFYIITQGPNLLDSNVRALIGRHIHLRDVGLLGRWWYEWPECADNCRTGWKNAPLKKRYKLPTKVFDQYKSASVHNKPKRSFPVAVVVALAAVMLTVGLAYKGYSMVAAKMSGAPSESVPTAPASAPLPQQSREPMMTAARAPSQVPDERVDFIPRISDRPHTAPVYDDLRKVVRVPYISGALCVNGKCKCYADKEYLPEVSSKACQQWADEKPFNPYVAAKGSEGSFTGQQTGAPFMGAGGMGVQTPHVSAEVLPRARSIDSPPT